jgi:hypothetical protein
MLHKSKLGEHAAHFPTDLDGHVPEPTDHWSAMNFEHGPHDPDEPGISEEEKARRVAYLDTEWWPSVLAHVEKGKSTLSALPGGNPIKHWRDVVMHEPKPAHGFQVEKADDD